MKRPTSSSDLRPTGAGLRLRLWLGCLAGALLAAGGVAVLLAVRPDSFGMDAELRWVLLPGLMGAAVVLGVAMALWLDLRLTRHLRGLSRTLERGNIAELRGHAGAAGWGELTELTHAVQTALSRQRLLARTSADLDRLTDRVGEARQVRATIASGSEAALVEARDVAEQTERGFVEATALLTTARELERLGTELGLALAPRGEGEPAGGVEGAALARYRQAAAAAIQELVTASGESVAHLSDGLSRAREIAELTRLMANRSTLIALRGVASGASVPTAADTEDLAALAREVREASDRVTTWTAEIDQSVASARERMESVRGRVIEALDRAAAESEATPVPARATGALDATRLHERLREMIQDTSAKGERLSAASERASRSAERLKKRIEGDAESIAALARTLGETSIVAPGAGSGGRGLRLVDRASDAETPDAAASPATELPRDGNVQP